MAIKSRFYSTCPLCGKRIKIGDMIDNKNSLGKWGHQSCKTITNINSKTSSISNAINSLAEVEIRAFGGVVDNSETFSFPTDFIPSVYQEAIFDFIINGKGHGVVEAVAGSGKTTTIVKALEYIPLALLVELKSVSSPQSYKDLSILKTYDDALLKAYMQKYRIAFLAFNKHIAKELKKRAPDYVHVSTLHSLGCNLMFKKFLGIQVDEDKVSSKMDNIFPISKTYKNSDGQEVVTPNNVKGLNKAKRFAMRKLVSLCKATLVDYRDHAAVQQMIEFYGMEIQDDVLSDVMANLPTILNRCKSDTRSMDYDDMLWMPIVHNLQTEKFHYLLVDEFQDLNNCQIEYVIRSLDDNGRIIGVGDRQQSLYGFRGADINAIPRMIKTLNATVLPLSISYRCPSSHVLLAQKIVPQLQASATAIKGSITNIKYIEFLNKIDVGDMVICRTNAPLISPAFEAIRRGKKAIIRGHDIGRSLVEFIYKFEADTLGKLDILMAEFTAVEYQKCLDRGRELQADLVMDKYETIKSVSNECKNVAELISKIKLLFDDSNIGIVFSSVHRAKGLEANRVFILRSDLMPHPKAKQPWEQIQESNAQYVAYTRSKEELYFVEKEL